MTVSLFVQRLWLIEFSLRNAAGSKTGPTLASSHRCGPLPFTRDGFAGAGPWRHRHRHCGQRLAAEAPELKKRAQWNRHADTVLDANDFLRTAGLLTPHLAGS